jgi:DNA-binding NarL/FixJ family response regulator
MQRIAAVTCAGAHASAEEALRKVAVAKPHVVLVDLSLGKVSGVDCIRGLRDLMPETPILAYTRHDDDQWLFPALAVGATGYLLKDGSPSELLDAILAAHRSSRRAPVDAKAQASLRPSRLQRPAGREAKRFMGMARSPPATRHSLLVARHFFLSGLAAAAAASAALLAASWSLLNSPTTLL